MGKERLNNQFNRLSYSLRKIHDQIADRRRWIIPSAKDDDAGIAAALYGTFVRPYEGLTKVFLVGPILSILTKSAELGADATGGRKSISTAL